MPPVKLSRVNPDGNYVMTPDEAALVSALIYEGVAGAGPQRQILNALDDDLEDAGLERAALNLVFDDNDAFSNTVRFAE